MATPRTPFDKLVNKYMLLHGFDLNIVRAGEQVYDPNTGTTIREDIVIPVRGIIFDLTLQSNGNSNHSKTLIEAGDKQLYIQPPVKSNNYYLSENIAFEVIPGRDTVIINGNIYKIVTFKEYNPTSSDSILWDLYIRK